MQLKKRIFGQAGEEAAAKYLRRRGYKILTKNYTEYRVGEVDLIAHKNGTLVFVEVKTRSNNAFGTPAEAVNYDKQQKLVRTADRFSKNFVKRGVLTYSRKILFFNLDWNCPIKTKRFDVIEVFMSTDGTLEKINHIKNAF